MIDLPVVEVKRVIDKKEAREMRGILVPDLPANITEAGIYVDAETKEPFMVYMPMPTEMVAPLRKAVRGVKYSSSGVNLFLVVSIYYIIIRL